MKGILSHKRIVLVPLMIVVFLGIATFQYRAALTHHLWHTFHLFPEITYALNKDNAELILDIGYYTFNPVRGGVYDINKAEQYLYRALALDPLIRSGWHQLARIDFLRGHFVSALWKINKQIEIHGDDFMPAYYIRGLIYAYDAQFEKSEVDFLKFLEWKPESWAARNDLAWVYFRQGMYDKAASSASVGLQYEPNSPWLLTMLGVSLLNLEQKDEAKNILTKALIKAEQLREGNWVEAYPGNDPRIARQGLAEMITAIEYNVALVGD